MTAALLSPAHVPDPAEVPLRLLPAPTSAPPYDDELATTGAPALRLVTPATAPLAPPRPPSCPTPFTDDAWVADDRTPTAELPSAEDFTRRIVQVLLEVVAGVRPISQLRRDTTPELYLSLRATLLCRPRPTGPRPDRRAIRSVHVQTRPEGIGEACATVRRGPRVTALALRIEGVDGRWRCTDLDGAARV
jgi:hypothetical protein